MKKSAFRFKKRYILIALILLLVTVTVGFFVFQGVKSGKIRFSADTTSTITNMATVTYQDGAGATYTASSNPIDVQIVTTGTVTLAANPTSINTGDSSTLTWTIADYTVDKCSATPPGWWTSALTGSVSDTPIQTTNYVLTCTEGGTATPVSQTATVIVDGTPVDKLATVTFSLQSRASAVVSGMTLKIFNAGTQTETIPAKTGLSSVESPGTISNISVNGLAVNTNYDFELHVNSYVVGKTLNKTFSAFPITIPFGELKGGDLSGDGIVDTDDYSFWKNQNPLADINGDGAINGSDYDILAGNWTP